MINRRNYESWFVDFLDGRLTDGQLAQLHAFLAQNPDLARELDEVAADLPVVVSDTVKSPIAKKEIAAVGSLNENSFETAFIAYHENDLSEAEIQELESFLAKNPFLRREFAWFGQLAVSHSGESFPRKRNLKHTVPLVPLYRYAAAASVLLLLGVGAVWYTRSEVSQGGLAYRPTSVRVPMPTVRNTEAYVNVSDTDALPAKTNRKKTQPTRTPERVRFKTVAKNQTEPFRTMEGAGSEPSLGQAPALYVTQTVPASGGDEMTLVQALGKAIETGVGENSVSSGLKEDRKITAGDMVDLVSTPFKKSGTPVLATENSLGGKRRIKVRLGIFEADFALK